MLNPAELSVLLVKLGAFIQNVLELEAMVQRDMTNASVWYELGVKQQENEREHKALQALQRAVELDPTHLPAWLALAISYTNDNNRQGTYDAIYEWVSRNEKYHDAVVQFRATNNGAKNMFDRYQELIQCLITMARNDTTGNVDADIQIALAVLLNTNEVRACLHGLRSLCTTIKCLFLFRNMKKHKIASERHFKFVLM